MLGKLFRHDMKALSRYLIMIHLVVFAAALIGRLTLTGHQGIWDVPNVAFVLYILAFILLLMAASFGTYVIIGVYFYRSLYSRQGYLTWTLPATSGQLLVAKTLTGFIWSLASFIMLIISGLLFFLPPGVSWSEIAASFKTELGLSFSAFWLALLFLSILSCFCGIISIYASITIGQLFSGHRVIAAVMIYAGINIILQIISGMIPFVTSNSYTQIFTNTLNESGISSFGSELMNMIMVLSLASLIEGVVFYLITHYIMQKKINII